MGLVIYSNGIIEEIISSKNVFSEEELVKSFDMYDTIKTCRLTEIPNCWCIWGDVENPPDYEFNKLATEVIEEEIYSHIIFVHDSELNLEWNVTNEIIYKSYTEFLETLSIFIKETMNIVNIENQKELKDNNESNSMIFLSTMGQTKDKRILFAFNPNEQNDSFYFDGSWDKFSERIHEYLKENFYKEPTEENKPFVIYSDTKNIVIVEDTFVDEIINKMVQHFETTEQYEKCSTITEIKKEWDNRKTLLQIDSSIGIPKKKRGRPPKNKND